MGLLVGSGAGVGGAAKSRVKWAFWSNARVGDKDFNRTLLIWATMEQRPTTVDMLLKHGTDSSAKDLLGKTALMYAYSSAAMRQVLLQQEAHRKETKR